MPLDSRFRQWLEDAAARPWPDFKNAGVEVIRAFFDEGNAAITRPPSEYPVKQVTDDVIDVEDGRIGLRWYTPTVHGSSAARPGVLFFHGGGFTIGSVDNYDTLCRALCRASKCVIISVDYRLAPEHRFPTAADDCLAALAHVRSVAHTHGVDRARLAVAGDSAGGQLAAVTALSDRGADAPPLRAQCLIYPQTDFSPEGAPSLSTFAEGYGLTRGARDWFVAQYLSHPAEALDPRAGLLGRDDLEGVPPALVITAEFDPLRDEGERYAQKLAEAGTQVVASRYYGVIHGFMRRVGQHPLSDQLIQQCGGWLREALTGKR
ncbi:alpha/beta hydrolase [Larsenimonas salina]|uniref:alpha/beta hydrolase n=1 Tax=Larsenimonas salina TaxID=1295565 RepID=UPI0020730383|nr:alpha/beta hydrolase [Larsenimonas salina]MCM5705428.1 alpha/beta hydrolase [Larsenimonas salina]